MFTNRSISRILSVLFNAVMILSMLMVSGVGVTPTYAALTFINKTTADGLGSNTVLGVFADGSTIYAATNGGLSISSDGGSTFTNKTTADGLGHNNVYGVFASGGTVYAATQNGLSISSDGGSTFTNKTTADGLGHNNVYGVFASGGTVYAATNNGLSISSDGGSTFTNKTTADGLGGNVVIGVFASGSTVYAASAITGGLSISSDGGSMFINKTTADGLAGNNARAVFASGSTVYAGANGGLSISPDGGNTFTNKTTANGLGTNVVVGVFANGGTVYAATTGGLSISSDGGSTFTNKTTADGLGGNLVWGVIVSDGTVYAATDGGLSIGFDDADTTAPTVSSIIRASADPTNAASVDFTVTFSESVSGVDTVTPFNDFDLSTTGVTGASITNVSGSDAIYTVSVNTGSGSGTIRLDVIDGDSILDAASLPLGGAGAGNGNFTTGQSYTIFGAQSGPTFTVNTTADSNGICDPTPGDCSLREAINVANALTGADTITLPAGTYTLTAGSELLVTSDITFNGAGAGSTFLQANAAANTVHYRVLHVNETGVLTLNSLTVRYGRCDGACTTAAGDGGGIYNSGTLTLDAVTVSGNTSTTHGGGILTNGTLTVRNSSVIGGGNGSANGGGLYNNGTTTIDASTVSGDAAVSGGGILNVGTLMVRNSSVIGGGNTATGGSGGGIYNHTTGTMTIDASTVGSNWTNVSGGGIYNLGALTIQNGSTVSGNPAINGGGIYNTGTATINASTVSGNPAVSGGGIYNQAGTTTVDGSTVSANTASDYGGGIFNNAALTIQTGSVIGGGNTASIHGGGIFNYGTVTVDASTVSANTAIGFGGGIYNNTTLTIQNGSTVSGNPASNGGGIYNVTGTMTINASTISGNPAVSGGGIFNAADLYIQNGSVIGGGNTATGGSGGGIYNTGRIQVVASTVGSNWTDGSGGGIYNVGNLEVWYSSTINANAAINGGGIYNSLYTDIDRSTISGNAAVSGGGIYNNNYNCSFFYCTYSMMTITASTITANTDSSGYGGGLFDDTYVTASVTGSCVVNNGAWELWNANATTQTARGNWWGAASGPIAGDSVYGNWDTSGFLTAPALQCGGGATGLKGNTNGLTQIDLGWTDNAGDESQFRVERSPNGTTGWTQIATPAANATSYFDSGLACGTISYYRVRAYRGSDGVYSSYSNVASVTTTPCQTDQTITVTTHAPSSAVAGDVFTVAAEAVPSSLSVTYSSSGACTNVGADFTMTSGTGTCTVRYDQAGNASYNPAPQLTENVTAQKAVLTVTANAQTKVYGTADPAFTFAYSGFVGSDDASNIDTPPTCNVTGAHVDVSSYPILCSGGSDDQYGFVYVDSTLTITKAEQNITVNTGAPASAVSGEIFNVSASASSGLPVSYGSSGSCTNVGATFTMTSGTGTCMVSYDQVGDTNYNPAPQITEVVGDANEAPVITEGASVPVTMFEDGPATFSLTLHATDPEGNTLTWSIATAASHGVAVASGTGLSKSIGYSPNTNYNGSDSFVVQVSDGALTDTITVNVAITAVNDNPSFTGGANQTVNEDAGPQIVAGWATNISAGPLDEASQIVTFYNGGNTNPALFAVLPAVNATTGSLTYTPAANANGTATISWILGDDGGSANGGHPFGPIIPLVITINAINDAPIITEGTSVNVTMSQGGSPAPFKLTLHATDIDSGITNLTWSFSTLPLHGVAAVVTGAAGATSTGTTSYTPNTGYIGTDSFIVKVNDGFLSSGITVNVTIRPVLTVRADSQHKEYGSTSDPAFTFSYSGFVGTEGPSNVDFPPTCTVLVAHVNVGNYPIVCAHGSDDKYDFVYVDNTLTVTPKPISVTADVNQSKVYGNRDPVLTYHVTSGSLLSTDSFSGSLTRTPGENVGDYDVLQGTLSAGNNYNLTYIPGGKLTITRKPITVTADPQSKVYGTADPSLTYQAPSGALVFTADHFSGSLTRVPGENVGAYAISQGTLSAGNNYTIQFISSNLTITARPITITADALSKAYGDLDPSLTYQVTSGALLSTDSFSGSLTRASGENVGSYVISQGTLTAGNNYNIQFIPGSLTITTRPIDVTADPQTINYGDADPAFTFSYGSFATGDGPNSIDTPPTCTVNGAHTDAGNYPILCSGGSDDQYDFIYASDTLTITQLPLTVTADAQSKVYGASDPALTYQVTSGALLSADSFSGNLARASGENVGVHAITQGTLTAGSNYNLTFAGANFTITKADQTITVTVNAPANAAIGSTFTVAATASSGLPVSYSSSGTCTNVGATFTKTSGTGVCVVNYDQAGDANYNPAPQVSQAVAVSGGGTPSLLTPANGEHLLTNRPTFDWTDVPGAISYTIQISGNSGFTGSPTSNTVTSSTFTQPSNLPVNVTRYWRVQATTGAGAGPWSAVRSFITGNPPTAPVLSAPANNALVTDYTPLLDWNDASMPTGTTFLKYEVQIAADSVFTSPTIVDATNSNYTVAADLNPNTTYYWQVRTYNTLGQYGPWSIRHFRTALLPPILTTPNDAEQLLNNRPTFDWADVSGATGYRIEISADPINFTSPITAKNITPSSFTPTADLPVGVTLYWRVQSRGTNGPSDWSVRVLTTANPSSVPTLASPANNAKVSGPSPLFDWNDLTTQPGVVFDHYQIQVATDSAFTNIVHDHNVLGITNSQDNTAVLSPATTYSWRVRSVNAVGGYSAWSTARTVKIKFAGPALTQPVSGSTVSSLMPTFTWDAASGATDYTIQVSKSPAFSSFAINQTATNTTYTHTANLKAGTTYYWRVRVRGPNTYGPGDWSQVFTFTTP